MKQASVKLEVRLRIEMPDWADAEAAVQQTLQEMDYKFEYRDGQLHIHDHEIESHEVTNVLT